MTRNEFLTQKTAHELSHAIEQHDNYKSIRQTLLNTQYQTKEELQQALQNKIEQYQNAGVLLDENDAMAELTAEALRVNLKDPRSTYTLLNGDVKFGNRIMQAIKDILWKIRKMFGGKNSEAYKNYQAVRELEQMYRNVYDAIRTIDKEANTAAYEARMAAIMNEENNLHYDIKTEENSEAETETEEKNTKEKFIKEYDNWDKKDRRKVFEVGRTSEALKSIGVKDSIILWDSSKILKIYNDHKNITDEILKQVPEVIENPVLIMESIDPKKDSKLILYGELYDHKNRPIFTVIELDPTIDNNYEINQIKVASVYTRENNQSIINRSNILYIDPNKNRTDTWLTRLGLQLPAGVSQYGSINMIKQKYQNNNPQKSNLQNSIETPQTLQDYLSEENRQNRREVKQFSLDTPIEETKNLIAVHTLPWKTLFKTLQSIGIIDPSI